MKPSQIIFKILKLSKIKYGQMELKIILNYFFKKKLIETNYVAFNFLILEMDFKSSL